MTTTEQTNALARKQEQTQAIEGRGEKGLTWAMITELTGYNEAQIALVSRTVAQGAPLQELVVFLHACRALQLDPLLRQAYWIRRRQGDEMKGALQVGIDGFRAIAERSGAYAGSEPPRFLGQIEITYQSRTITVPDRAQVVVWKIVQGHKAAFTGEAHWSEFCPSEKDAFMWRKMPRHMLAKCAEGQALRKAFPALLGAMQMGAELDEAVEGDLPEVGVPARIVEQPQRTDAERVAANAARHAEIFEETEPVEMVKAKSDPRWKAWVAATGQASANEVAFEEITLPIAAHALEAATQTLLDMVADKQPAEQGAF